MPPLSREFLLSRGTCCANGCINCPYKEEEVSMLARVKSSLTREITNSVSRIAKLKARSVSLGDSDSPLDSQSSLERSIENERKRLNSLESRKQECVEAEVKIAFLGEKLKELEQENRTIKRKLKKIVSIMEHTE